MVIECSKGFKEWLKKDPSPTAKEGEILRKLAQDGKEIIDLGGASLPRYKDLVNEVATKHLIQAATEEWGTYPGSSAPLGLKENAVYNLRKAISGFLGKYCNISFTPERIIIGHATSGVFAMLHLALLNVGDEICAVEPSHYVMQESMPLPMLRAKMVTVSSDPENNWEPDLNEMRNKLNERTKAIVIAHPTNPTGVIYSDDTLKGLIEIADEYEVPIISDELYQLITYRGLKAKSLASLAGDVPVIVTGSMSKLFMKPGWCTGYACFHDPTGKIKEIEDAVKLLSNTPGFGGTRIATPILVAAARTYEDSIDHSFEKLRKVEQNIDFVYKRLNEIEGISLNIKPQCAFYGLFRIDEIGLKNSRWSDDYSFCCDILENEGLYFRPGSEYGKTSFGYARMLMYREKTVLEQALNKLERFMKTKK